MNRLSTVAASGRADATIFLSENPLRNIGAATLTSLGDSKNGEFFRTIPI